MTFGATVGATRGPDAASLSSRYGTREDSLRAMGAPGAVVFTLDDIRSEAKALITLHEARMQRVGIGVVSSWVGDAGRMTEAELIAYHQAGHELCNHTDTHITYSSSSASQRATDTDTCAAYLESITGVPPVTFIYPQGAWSAASDQELFSRGYRSWAATLSSATNMPSAYPKGDTFPRFYRIDLDSPANLERATTMVRLAAQAPIVVAFYTHWTDQVGTMTTAQYTEVLDLVDGLNIPCLLPREAFGSASLLADPSFEATGMPTWFTTQTGDGAVSQATVTPDSGMSGTKAVQLTATGPGTALVSQPVIVEPGVVMRLTGRIKTTAGSYITNDVGIRVRWRAWDESAVSTSSNYPTLSAAPSAWSRFSHDVTVPAGVRFAWIDIIAAPGSTRNGTVQVDHLDFRPAHHGGFG